MPDVLSGTPARDGYRMPGEFEPHAGTWMLWPERPDNWREQALPGQRAFAKVAAAIAGFEPVTIGVRPDLLDAARRLVPEAVRLVPMEYNDSWMRDCGPIFVKNDRGGLRMVDWGFNSWGGLQGGLYAPWDKDERVPEQVSGLTGIDRYVIDMVLEGGSIHVDGHGTLLTTEECLLNPNRNPGLDRARIEQSLSDYLGVEKIVWLPKGVFNDETNGHVDNLCAFAAPGRVTLTWTEDRSDPQYEISAAAQDCLAGAVDARGRRLQVIPIHQPDPILITEVEAAGVTPVDGTFPRLAGDRMAASYINAYLANGCVVVPIFGDRHDDAALATYGELFTGRQVVGIPAREILLGGGNVHCITQQQPAP